MLRVASRNNPRYREVARLVSSSRDRRKAGRCVLEGEHLVAAHLERGHLRVPEQSACRLGNKNEAAKLPPRKYAQSDLMSQVAGGKSSLRAWGNLNPEGIFATQQGKPYRRSWHFSSTIQVSRLI